MGCLDGCEMVTFEFFLGFYPFILAILALYYWIVLDEMKGQHPIRRKIYLMFVPLCIFLAPFTIGLSILPMCFFIALGEAFDKPTSPKPTEFDIKVEKFFIQHKRAKPLYTIILTLILSIWFLLNLLIRFGIWVIK